MILFKEIEYGISIPAGVVLSSELTKEDTTKDNPEGLVGVADVSKYYTVKLKSLGGAVRRLQTWLNDIRGGDLLSEDGEFGPNTEKAVKAFQTEKGLSADGIVGAKTWAALAEARNAAITASQQSGEQNE